MTILPLPFTFVTTTPSINGSKCSNSPLLSSSIRTSATDTFPTNTPFPPAVHRIFTATAAYRTSAPSSFHQQQVEQHGVGVNLELSANSDNYNQDTKYTLADPVAVEAKIDFQVPMATTALASVKSHHSRIPDLQLFRNEAHSACLSTPSKHKLRFKARKAIFCLQNGILRRDFMFGGLSSSLSLMFPTSVSGAEEQLKMDLMIDDINAYSYLYPTEMPSKFVFKWAESRKPERYSSAAPLSPDARLRIVSERVDFIDNLIISVAIGPPNSLFLKTRDKSMWNAKDVADSVLADKSALRVTSSQRMNESSVLAAQSSTIDGEPYWFYEYLVRKSPTKTAQESNLYRHFVAATAERDGYLYSLSASTLNKQWGKIGPFLEKTAASFRLVAPTENYTPPFKDPWRFW